MHSTNTQKYWRTLYYFLNLDKANKEVKMLERIVFVLLVFGLLSIITADTIPGGNVSGTWYQSHSPYYINGNILIQASDTLTIEPGVLVNFLGYYSFTVNGILEAVGTESDSIIFTAGTDWWGLLIENAPDSSRLEYCTFEADNAYFGLIYCLNSNPVISHCQISNNASFVEAGGITLINSGPRISFCTISRNRGVRGGGIRCSGGSTPFISHCRIDGNHAEAGADGGGAVVEGESNPVFDNCVISCNLAYRGGGIAVLDGSSCSLIACIIDTDSAYGTPGPGVVAGGIFMNSPTGSLTCIGSTIINCYSIMYGGGVFVQSAESVSFERSIIDNNYSFDLGGALYSVACRNLFIDHCDIVKNRCNFNAGGIMLGSATALNLTNCIFRGQNGCDIYFDTDSSVLVSYNDFYNSAGGSFYGNPPTGLGTLVQTNANGDSCDIFYNIFLDPFFEDFSNRDYHLTDSSPCIDAGDTASPYDPDSTITDMGVFWFNQVGIEQKPVKTRSRITGYIGATIFKGPLVLPKDKTCHIFDITGRTVKPVQMKPGVYFLQLGTDLQKVLVVR